MDDSGIISPDELTDESTTRIVQTKRWKIKINEAGDGQPVFMLHGTGPGATGWSNFNQNFRALASKYRVILVDAPGWGQSDPLDPAEGGMSGTSHVDALKLLMDELAIEKAVVVGNSMGGQTTLRFCATHPERVTHAVTMGAGLFGTNIFSPGGLSEGIRIIVDTYRDPSPENFRRLVNIMVFDSSFVTDELVKQRSAAALADKLHLENWLKAWGARRSGGGGQASLAEQLGRFQQPCLFIHGRDDRVVPMEGTLRAVSVVPNSRAVILNRCGHWAQVEHAAEFNALLDSFLTRTASGAPATDNKAFGS